MSRVGKAPITLPDGVQVNLQGSTVEVKGPRGSLKDTFHPEMTIEMNAGELQVQRPSDSRQHRALHGLTRALLNNMVLGVSKGFVKKLQVDGVGYRAEMDGNTLVLHVGYSHPVRFEPVGALQFTVENRGKTITVEGNDKQLVGEYAARIRKTRPPEPYKGKGIRYDDEIIRRKAGKAGKV